MLPPKRQFGQRLRRIRKSQNLSQEKLALQAGLSLNYVSNVELGRHSIGLEAIYQLAEALNIHPALLFMTKAESEQFLKPLRSEER